MVKKTKQQPFFFFFFERGGGGGGKSEREEEGVSTAVYKQCNYGRGRNYGRGVCKNIHFTPRMNKSNPICL